MEDITSFNFHGGTDDLEISIWKCVLVASSKMSPVCISLAMACSQRNKERLRKYFKGDDNPELG